jgi:chromosome segregation ATPase
MTAVPENLVLKQLSSLRAEMQEGFAEIRTTAAQTNEKLGAVAQTLVGLQRDVRNLQREVATLGVAVDEHTHRLDRIEKRLGLIDA